jgi:PKD repeat protein
MAVTVNLSLGAQCPDLVCNTLAITKIVGTEIYYSFEIENIGNDTLFLNKVVFQNYVSTDSLNNVHYAAGGAYVAYGSKDYLLPTQKYIGDYQATTDFATQPCPFIVVQLMYNGKTECITSNNYVIKRIALVPPVDAQFLADITTGTAPLTVHFTDQSTGEPTTWSWDFNNDKVTDSTSQNPSFIYKTPGTYAVRFISSKVGSRDSIIKTAYIIVNKQTSAGVNNPENDGWEIYPNPSRGPVNVILGEKIRNQDAIIKIYDNKGKMIFLGKPGNKTNLTFDFSKFCRGIFVVEIVCGKEVFKKKFIIQ